MRRVYDIRIVVSAPDLDDCEDTDSLVEQLGDLIEVGKLELGECKPEYVGARMTDTSKSLKVITQPKPRKRVIHG